MNTSAKSYYESDHKDIPGNPSTSKTSVLKLNRRENNEPLRVLSETQWNFWRENGYVVIKNAISREQSSTIVFPFPIEILCLFMGSDKDKIKAD